MLWRPLGDPQALLPMSRNPIAEIVARLIGAWLNAKLPGAWEPARQKKPRKDVKDCKDEKDKELSDFLASSVLIVLAVLVVLYVLGRFFLRCRLLESGIPVSESLAVPFP
jgi:hypothetical protein